MMKYSIQYYPEQNLVVEQVEGEITLDGLRDKTKALLADPRYKRGSNGVSDLRKAHTSMSREELREYSKFMKDSNLLEGSTWAVISHDPMVIALTQVLQKKVSDSSHIEVFGSLESAARFLGKPEVLDLLDE